ncbi:MAG: TonB-dependent receptor [Burkholderiales bacterium]|nr:TonB-dependent receptor [Burkholderiales bacterium]
MNREARPQVAETVAPEVRVRSQRPSEDPTGRAEATVTRSDLRRRSVDTIGAALEQTLGVHNSSFGPGVGLPVIRGLSGARVKVLVGGLGSHDASTTSPDHVVAAEPITADRIRVVRGPATVRYGSGAIGGAVEVEDGRIPQARTRRPLTGAVEGRYASNGANRVGSVRLDGTAGPLVLHVDGWQRQRNNLGISGRPIDEAAIRQQFGLRARENPEGFVPNSDSDAAGAAAGASLVGDRGFVGLSFGSMRNNYGIPGGAHTHSHGGVQPVNETDNVRIDMAQSRVDTHARLAQTPWTWLDQVEFKAGQVDYRHDEVDSGFVATRFLNRAFETRTEAALRAGDHLTTAVGFHTLQRKFSALGAEAFVPESDIASRGVYAIPRLEFGRFSVEAAVRQEWQHIAAQPRLDSFGILTEFPVTQYRPASGGVSATWQHDARNALTVGWTRAERAPDVQELYSLGPHLATRTYDFGNPDLRTERLTGPEAGVRLGWGPFDWSGNAYRYDAQRYIFQRTSRLFYDTEAQVFRVRCARVERCLQVTEYQQQDVDLRGFETQLAIQLPRVNRTLSRVTLFADYVNAQFADGSGDVPRMPPRRHGFELQVVPGNWSARLRVTQVAPQLRPGLRETPTAGYTMVNLSLDWRVRLDAEGRETILYFNGNNLLDQQVRNATSFIRNFSPEAGRSFEVGLRATF